MIQRGRRASMSRPAGARRPSAPAGRGSDALPDDEVLNANPDSTLATTTLLLMAIGIAFVYSAGAMKGYRVYDSTSHFLARQVMSALIGFGFMYIVSRVSLRKLDAFARFFGFLTLGLLVAVLIPGLGVEINGARRWLNLGPLGRFQPSEFARLASVLLVAKYAARNTESLRSPAGLCKCLFLPALFCALILLQPDFDTALTVLMIGCIILFVAGVPWMYVTAGAGIGVVGVAFLILTEGYRLQRIVGFLDPWSDARGKGYQIIQCWIAMGSGGFFGKGLGASIQKLGYLPEAHTDFIFAVIGEEGGFILAALVVLLFAIITWKGYRIAAAQAVPFARYVGVGVTSMISLQALLNLMVVTGLAPTTGVPLPLISYGGTSLIFMTAALGILWGLSRRVPNGTRRADAAGSASARPVPSSHAASGGRTATGGRGAR